MMTLNLKKPGSFIFSRLIIVFAGILFILPTACEQTSTRGNLQERDLPFSYHDLSVESDEFSVLRELISFQTDTVLNAFIEYWEVTNENEILRSDTSENKKQHLIKLSQLKPETDYMFKLITFNSTHYSESKAETFKSRYIPVWLDNYYTPQQNTVDVAGKILIYQRKSPGVLVLLGSNGKIQWYNAFNNFLKTALYTKDKTYLCILSDPGYETAYGNHLIEMNDKGDTLVHFQTGVGTFNKIFHHDLMLDKESNIVVLTLEKRKFDLSSVGGKNEDLVSGDGIQIISKDGKILWEWSVFDVVNPLNDPLILKEKEDWLHANSFCYDKDGNFLVSFYKTNQIWKIDSKSGKLIWKLGDDGDFKLNEQARFSGQHSIHINKYGHLMFFDNGLKTKISRAISFEINESEMSAQMIINAPLSSELHSPRMGSAYLLNDQQILQCSTNKDKVVATDLKGNILWQFNTGGLTYRAQFIEE